MEEKAHQEQKQAEGPGGGFSMSSEAIVFCKST